MILIIEGADLVGKSTLAERVAAAHRWPIVKIRWALDGDPKAETIGIATATIELLRALKPDVILDRSYLSMWAYGEERAYLPEQIARLDRLAGETAVRLVLLTVTPDELRRRYEREPDAFFSLEIITRANDRYPSLLPLVPPSVPRLHIDTTTVPPDEVFAQVEAFLCS